MAHPYMRLKKLTNDVQKVGHPCFRHYSLAIRLHSYKLTA